MRIFCLICILLITSATLANSQDLYFTLIDSLDYSPRSLNIGDFNGDTLDELVFSFTANTMIINPRNHQIIFQTDSLRSGDAVCMNDANDDDIIDIISCKTDLIHRQNNIGILLGPEYLSPYTWSMWANHLTSRVFGGIWPVYHNIITQSYTLCSIDPTTWNYSCALGNRADKTGDLIAEIENQYVLIDPNNGYDAGKITFFTSSLDSLYACSLYIQYTSPNHQSNIHFFGSVHGIFHDSQQGRYITAIFTADTKTRIVCFDSLFNINIDVIDTVYPGDNWQNQHIIAADLDGDGVDNIYLLYSFPGILKVKEFSGNNLHYSTYVEIPIDGFSYPFQAKIYDREYLDIVFKGTSKVYIGRLSLSPLYINNNDLGLPGSFFLSIYPNPFNSDATIQISGTGEIPVSIGIYDINGRQVRALLAIDGQVIWDGRDDQGQTVASGVYLARAVVGSVSATNKLVLLK